MRYVTRLEYKLELFFFYDNESGRVDPREYKVGYVSAGDRCTCPGFDVHPRQSAMTPDHCGEHSMLYAEESAFHVWYS